MVELDKLFTVGEIATLHKVNKRTVYRWIDSGELKAVRINRTIRIKQSDYQGFLNGGK